MRAGAKTRRSASYAGLVVVLSACGAAPQLPASFPLPATAAPITFPGGIAAPSVDRAFVHGHDGALCAVDLQRGECSWSRAGLDPLVATDDIVFAYRADDHSIVGLDRDGDTVFLSALDVPDGGATHVSSAATLRDERLFVSWTWYSEAHLQQGGEQVEDEIEERTLSLDLRAGDARVEEPGAATSRKWPNPVPYVALQELTEVPPRGRVLGPWAVGHEGAAILVTVEGDDTNQAPELELYAWRSRSRSPARSIIARETNLHTSIAGDRLIATSACRRGGACHLRVYDVLTGELLQERNAAAIAPWGGWDARGDLLFVLEEEVVDEAVFDEVEQQRWLRAYDLRDGELRWSLSLQPNLIAPAEEEPG